MNAQVALDGMLLLSAASVILILSLASQVDGLFTLRILHTNDFHSRFEPVKDDGGQCINPEKSTCYGGIARLKYSVDQVKRSNPDNNLLFLNGGDFFQGTVWYTLFKWPIVANMTSMMNYDASSLGNHEFDDGDQDLADFAEAVNFPLLACNVELLGDNHVLEGKLRASIVKELSYNGDTRRVGIIGYVLPETRLISNPGPGVSFKDEIESLRLEVSKLKEDGVDILIAVGHSGYETDLRIAQEVEGLDLVVGGHTNTFLWNGTLQAPLASHVVFGNYPTVVHGSDDEEVKTLVVQTNGYGLYLGDVTVAFDDDGHIDHWSGQPVLMDPSIPKDEGAQALVDHFRSMLGEKIGVKIGATEVFIDGKRPKCRIEECALGNFITDALRSEMKVDIAFVNSGSMKEAFYTGDMKIESVYNVLPFDNPMDSIKLNGRAVRLTLEHSVSQYVPGDPDPGGRMLQVAGLIVSFDIRRPIGSRVVKVLVGKPDDPPDQLMPLADDKVYEVAISRYLVGGGDEYSMIQSNLLENKISGFNLRDLVIKYIQKISPVRKLPTPGRILIFMDDHAIQAASSGLRYLDDGKMVASILLSLLPAVVQSLAWIIY